MNSKRPAGSALYVWLVVMFATDGAYSAATAPATEPASQPAPSAWDPAAILTEPHESAEHRQAELDRLRAILAAADAPVDQAQARLAIANRQLGEAAAWPATRCLLGAATDDDRARLADAAASASELLAGAVKLLDAAEDADEETRRHLAFAAETLETFAKAFSAITTDPADKHYEDTLSDAALELAAARESEDEDVAAAALLWQSYAWVLAGRRDQAILALPDVLKQPERMPFDLFARLLRCRLLAEAGQHAAPVTLCLRMQHQCESWFPGRALREVGEIQRLIVFVRIGIVRSWIEGLGPDSAAGQRLSLDVKSARESWFEPPDARAVYSLTPAIPILVTPPKVDLPRPAAQTRPATAPASEPAAASHPANAQGSRTAPDS